MTDLRLVWFIFLSFVGDCFVVYGRDAIVAWIRIAEESLYACVRTVASVAKHAVERSLWVKFPVNDFLSICGDHKLRVFVENGAARNTTPWELWNNDFLFELEAHSGATSYERYARVYSNVVKKVPFSLVLI